MKKFTFLIAFLAVTAFAMPSWAAQSAEPHGEDIIPDDLEINESPSGGAGNSSSDVTKNRPFTSGEAADATKDNGKNSVTINF